MTTACIVQARMGSTRLPGKVMRRLAGETVLSHVLRRCQAIPGVDCVVCATVAQPADDVVAREAERAGALVFRGAERDVLGRYRDAARAVGAQRVMRVTSDCPLIDPALCGRVLVLCGADGVEFACNNMPPSWPHGLDCEAFTTDLLERAAATADDPDHREHVTGWMRETPGITRANVAGPGGALAAHRWTLDYPEDFAFFAGLFPLLPPSPALPGMAEVLAVLDANPGLTQINAHRRAA